MIEDPIARQLGFGRAPLGASASFDVSAQFHTQLQGQIDRLDAAGKAELESVAGVDASNPRVQQGAVSALSLVQHGFTPGNEADEAALIHTIAGGLCLAGPVGAAIGAYIEALWQVGNALACPTERLFASLGFGDPSPACGGQPCASTGHWTTQGVMAASRLPDLVTGTFRALAIPALATYIAQASNCKANFPPSVVVDGAVAMWNAVHEGPSVDLYVPPLFSMATSEGIVLPFWDNVTGCLTSDPKTCNVDPNVYYAFYPILLMPWASLDQIVQAAPPPPEVTPLDPPRIVSIQGGALLPADHPRVVSLHFGSGGAGSMASSPSTGKKVAIGAAVAVGSVLTTSALVAWARGEAFGHLWSGVWKKVRRA